MIRSTAAWWRVASATLALSLLVACQDRSPVEPSSLATAGSAPLSVTEAEADISDAFTGGFVGPRYEDFVCSLDGGPIVIEGTMDLSAASDGDVVMLGLIDRLLHEDPAAYGPSDNTSWGSGAYAYFNLLATDVRIGPTDGFNGGEIVQAFATVPRTSDDLYDFTLTVDASGNVTVTYAGSDIVDTYGDVEDASGTFDAAGNDVYPHDEFEFGAVIGVDIFPSTTDVNYRLKIVSGCAPADDQPPVVEDVTADPVAVGAAGTVSATVDDAATGGSDIASASLVLDGGSPIAMAATDGAFDDPVEGVTGSFTAPTVPGLFEVCVTGTDAATNTSEPECNSVAVYDPAGGFVTGGGWIDSPSSASTETTVSSTVWDQGFESDAAGWFDGDDSWFGTVTAVPSGTDGIPSSVGSGHAIMEGDATSAPFSRFDGFRDTWKGSWTAEIDVYLDPAWADGSGFDYSVAATGTDGDHQRDYIFHVTKDASTGALLVAGSNNTNFAPRQDLENIDHHEVTQAGWYTLQHVFREQSGALAVDLNLLDENGSVLFTETRFNAADLIPAEVGGNRYAWFTVIDVPGGVAVDEHELRFPTAPTGKASFGFVAKYKKGADVPDGNTQFRFEAAALNFHSTSYEWLVVTGSDFARFKGEGTVNGIAGYDFMLWAGDGTGSDGSDEFRIRITDRTTGDVVYDNGMNQPISGGNIMVHDGKGKK